MTKPIPPDPTWAPRKLTHDQARQEQLDYAATLTVPQRLQAMTELNQRMYRMRGIDLADSETDWTVTRVRRERR